jgi:type IX secretion system PorP/SprF family membrane protein
MIIRISSSVSRLVLAGLILIGGLIQPRDVSAQQEPLYTQFAFNKLAFNPAYAGSRKMLDLTAMYRYQWAGFEGAPQTATFSAHMPLSNQRMGLGLLFYSDRHGIISQQGFQADYAYRIRAGRGALAMGISAGLEIYKADVIEATGGVSIDPNLQSDINRILPNAGFGIYYNEDRFFVGASVPKLIRNPLTNEDFSGDDADRSRQSRHYFLMAGYVFDAGSVVKIRPSGLFRYAANSPASFDVNLSALFADRVWIGAGYRYDAAVTFNMEFSVTRDFNIGYAYDLATNALKSYSRGSHEVMVNYGFRLGNSPVVTPRDIAPHYF